MHNIITVIIEADDYRIPITLSIYDYYCTQQLSPFFDELLAME